MFALIGLIVVLRYVTEVYSKKTVLLWMISGKQTEFVNHQMKELCVIYCGKFFFYLFICPASVNISQCFENI